MKRILKLKIAAIVIVAAAAVAAVWWLATGTDVHVEKTDKLEPTPLQVEQIRSIGQWEFLSVSDEEIADTIRHGFFSDDELSRIYYGTLSLGIDFDEAGEDWIKMDADTVVVSLPPVKLLDDNFIDEARTKSFVEDGKWSEADRAALTRKATKMMRDRCLTRENIRKAEANAKKQVAAFFHSMGYQNVRITFPK